jgi:hypothetical protein
MTQYNPKRKEYSLVRMPTSPTARPLVRKLYDDKYIGDMWFPMPGQGIYIYVMTLNLGTEQHSLLGWPNKMSQEQYVYDYCSRDMIISPSLSSCLFQ